MVETARMVGFCRKGDSRRVRLYILVLPLLALLFGTDMWLRNADNVVSPTSVETPLALAERGCGI
jgi:hypothetical protein